MHFRRKELTPILLKVLDKQIFPLIPHLQQALSNPVHCDRRRVHPLIFPAIHRLEGHSKLSGKFFLR